mmetsp:Transcript_4242/g.14954  ORF Transcript_4242/g.14954 Transcript_4242/m.14954 type:complete len:230 (-) Transcript_4242:725-1414(-)
MLWHLSTVMQLLCTPPSRATALATLATSSTSAVPSSPATTTSPRSGRAASRSCAKPLPHIRHWSPSATSPMATTTQLSRRFWQSSSPRWWRQRHASDRRASGGTSRLLPTKTFTRWPVSATSCARSFPTQRSAPSLMSSMQGSRVSWRRKLPSARLSARPSARRTSRSARRRSRCRRTPGSLRSLVAISRPRRMARRTRRGSTTAQPASWCGRARPTSTPTSGWPPLVP